MARTDNNWIQTFTGRQFWPTNPAAEDIAIEDIAHALSNLCRFTGHTRTFYSVAQHSVMASYHCEDSRWGLMHDAAEAYLCDFARPLKRELPRYCHYERRLLFQVSKRFELPWPMPDCVSLTDAVLLATERRDLMGRSSWPWNLCENVMPIKETIVAVPPDIAEAQFLERFRELWRWK